VKFPKGLTPMLRILALAILIAGLTSSERVSAQQLIGISGACVDDQLFVMYPPKPKSLSILMRASLEKAGTNNAYPQSRVAYDTPILGGVRGSVSKLCLAHDRLWLVGPGHELFHSIPIDDLHYFEDNAWAAKREKAKFGERTGDIGGPYGRWVEDLFFLWDGSRNPEITFALKQSGLEGVPGMPLDFWGYHSQVIRKANFDLVPTGAESFTLVYLTTGLVDAPANRLVFQSMLLGSPHGAKKYVPTKPDADAKPWSVKAPFEGDFWAYEVGGVYYLLTRKGKLYAVKKNKESVATSTIWQDEKKYLIGAIQDVAKGTVYAFGVDGKDGERFAFEFGLEPKVTKYKTEAKVGDGFKEAQDCVRAVKPAAQKK